VFLDYVRVPGVVRAHEGVDIPEMLFASLFFAERFQPIFFFILDVVIRQHDFIREGESLLRIRRLGRGERREPEYAKRQDPCRTRF